MGFSVSRRTLLLAASAYSASNSFAINFPARSIDLVVPYPPGGSTDLVARMLATKIGPMLGQSLVIDNRGGASGNLGASYVARSPADGHRLLMGANAIVTINPHVFKNPGFDPLKDLAPVSQVCNGALALAVSGQSNIHSLPELVVAAKRDPKGFFYATPSAGTPQHLMGELLAEAAAIKLTPVHYKGVAPALNDTLSGTVPVMFSSYAVLKPHLDAGKLRILAVGTQDRIAVAPQIPTIAETYPGFEASLWFGIFAPAGTPTPVLETLEAAFSRAVASPDAQKLLHSLALPPVGGTRTQLSRLLRRDYESLGKLIRTKQITAE